jgi:hypothetical protein
VSQCYAFEKAITIGQWGNWEIGQTVHFVYTFYAFARSCPCTFVLILFVGVVLWGLGANYLMFALGWVEGSEHLTYQSSQCMVFV